MTASLLCSNILMYALQIGALIAVAGMVSLLLLQEPKIRLFYWQMVLLACLLLPFVRSWKQPVTAGNVDITMSVLSVAPHPAASQFPFTSAELILVILAAGILARVSILSLGFWRLRGYRIHSHPMSTGSSWGSHSSSPEADIRVSSEMSSAVPGPVTFGFLHPVILLPPGFPTLDNSVQEAILCHEILHVRRRDWLFTLGEELVRAVFWFHPAIWWLLSEIQLAREQAVDREVVSTTKARDRYVDALLAIAGARPFHVFAPLFLRKRHLKRRVFSILKEVRMSKTRTLSALAASMGMLVASCWFVSGALPLRAAPQTPAIAPAASAQPVAIRNISIVGLPEQQKADLLSHLGEAGIREGQQQQTSAESLQAIAQTIVNTYNDNHLRAQIRSAGADQVDLVIETPQEAALADLHPIRVGSLVQEANVLQKVPPVYPELAKAARVQGIVKLEIIIGKDGAVRNMRLLSGPPLLIQSAMKSVQEWTWKPTLLNGQPTDVVTTVDVNYTLAP